MFTRNRKLEWTPAPAKWDLNSPAKVLAAALFLLSGMARADTSTGTNIAVNIAPLASVYLCYHSCDTNINPSTQKPYVTLAGPCIASTKEDAEACMAKFLNPKLCAGTISAGYVEVTLTPLDNSVLTPKP